MPSRFAHLREQAETLRKQGRSIGSIEVELGIPRSTLSGWFRTIRLSKTQQLRLEENQRAGMVRARSIASAWHRAQKEERLARIKEGAHDTLATINMTDNVALELALAFLYLGEGAKTGDTLRLGNSNPMIVKFYIDSLERLYGVPRSTFYFALHLRDDQDECAAKEFWSATLRCSLDRFRYCFKDSRTKGRPTRPEYRGVCLVSGGPVEIQRRLLYLAKAFCERTGALSSAG